MNKERVERGRRGRGERGKENTGSVEKINMICKIVIKKNTYSKYQERGKDRARWRRGPKALREDCSFIVLSLILKWLFFFIYMFVINDLKKNSN